MRAISEGADRVDCADFAAAVDRHYPGLIQRPTLVLHIAEEAKDVAQETYLRAYDPPSAMRCRSDRAPSAARRPSLNLKRLRPFS